MSELDRKNFIGASEVSTLLGLNPFSTPLQLFALKTGKVEQDEQTEPQYWGKKKERIISERFAEDHNVKLMAYKKRFVHPSMPYFSCELDNIIVGTEEIVEIKSVNEYQWKQWSNPDELPLYIIVQVTAQMGLSKRNKAWVACLCGASKYIEKEVKFDKELWNTIETKVKDFWENYILKNAEPIAEADDNSFVVQLHPKAGTEIKEASEDLSSAIALLQQTKAEIIDLEKTKDTIEAQVKSAIGDLAGIETPEYICKWLNIAGSTFTITKKPGRQLRITKKGK